MARLLLADDHTMLRECLRRSLESCGHTVVAEAGDGAEAVDRAERLRPDVAVLDVTMPGTDGIEAARQLRARSLGIPVVVLTMHHDDDIVAEARAAGASSVLMKDCTTAELVAAIESAVRRPLGGPAAGTAGAKPVAPRSVLSRRECEVLQLVAEGATPTELAERLYISRKTVKNHLASIYEKLGCHDRAQALVRGAALGLIRLGVPG